ncbi:hypothetical protein [Myxococcus sp. AB025B]|uniref:hypothetical protein n=1 Tax=Myxococcus sp. AB025B TaxID=2562794 RepID=UPI0011413DB6|nr:hypothetical protein [Myxococcus sp. AB025B]
MRSVSPPDYAGLGAAVGHLVTEKQRAYGKAVHVLALLYPDGIPRAKFDDALAVVRVVDKLFRVATDRDALGESLWRDIAGYALLATERVERQRRRRGGSR